MTSVYQHPAQIEVLQEALDMAITHERDSVIYPEPTSPTLESLVAMRAAAIDIGLSPADLEPADRELLKDRLRRFTYYCEDTFEQAFERRTTGEVRAYNAAFKAGIATCLAAGL